LDSDTKDYGFLRMVVFFCFSVLFSIVVLFSLILAQLAEPIELIGQKLSVSVSVCVYVC